MQELNPQSESPAGELVSFDLWIRTLNRTRATGHRWRKQFPCLKVLNVFGKLCVTRASIAEFERRALAGEFQRDVRPPNPHPFAAILPHPGRPRKIADKHQTFLGARRGAAGEILRPLLFSSLA
jgi:hypothetical protein